MASTSLAGVPDLPDDVLLSVFKFLPIPDLARCAAVCERWHRIVTGFSHLWKGKNYESYTTPSESAETCAVLQALPPFPVADIKMHDFLVYISYPYLYLSVTDISDLGVVGARQRLACASLLTDIHIAEVVFSSRSPISFAALQKLQIVNEFATPEPGTEAERVIGSALDLCPNLRELSVRVDSLSAERLDAVEGLGRLQTLEIFCYRLEKLAFLRHCSDTLEELQLECCCEVPSATFAALGWLGNLRRLQLRDCRVVPADVEAAAPGLRSLESLQLEHCYFLLDLSFLRHFERLHELRVTDSINAVTGLWCLPVGVRSLYLADSGVTADELSEALARLPQLEELSLSCAQLDHLGFLRHCPQRLGNLRRLWLRDCRVAPADAEVAVLGLRSLELLQLQRCYFLLDLSFLRHCGRLRELWVMENGDTVTGLCRLPVSVRSLYLADSIVTADELSKALTRLPQLEELSLRCMQLDHLGFLRHCPQLQHFFLDDAEWPSATELSKLRHLERLETLDLMGHSIDVDALFGLMDRLEGRLPLCDWDVSYLVRHSAVKYPTW